MVKDEFVFFHYLLIINYLPIYVGKLINLGLKQLQVKIKEELLNSLCFMLKDYMNNF